MPALGLHAASGLHVGFFVCKNLPIQQTALPKREKSAKRNESSTTKNKKKQYYNEKKGIAVYSRSQALDETAILTRQDDPFVNSKHQ